MKEVPAKWLEQLFQLYSYAHEGGYSNAKEWELRLEGFLSASKSLMQNAQRNSQET